MTEPIDELAALRKRRAAVATKAPRRTSFTIAGDKLEVDGLYPGVEPCLVFTEDLARTYGNCFLAMAHKLRVARNAKSKVPPQPPRLLKVVDGKSQRKMPPLKIRGWAVEVIRDGKWSRVSFSRSRERVVNWHHATLEKHPHTSRLVAIDHRRRIIAPERMPPGYTSSMSSIATTGVSSSPS